MFHVRFVFYFLILQVSYGQSKAVKKNTNEVSVKWAKQTLYFINLQTNKSPTFISRSLGYMGLVMYECVVNGSQKYRSIASELNGLGPLSKHDKNLTYDWETVLNAGQSSMLKQLWQPLKQVNGNFTYSKVDSLEMAILKQRRAIVRDSSVIERSIKYGQTIANEIFSWSISDGGHERNFMNFDLKYQFPSGPNFWTPPLGGQSSILLPLHPNWGKNRNFLKVNSNLPIPKMLAYSTDSTSAYFKQFKEVYDIQRNLTQQQKEIANWWGDDPSYSTSPPGHTYNLAIILNENKHTDLVKSAMTFARVGMACADAFINCWRIKYTYHSERPTQYIRKNIDKNFTQYWPEPPFPAFPSGHSMQSAAGAEVLIDVFGDEVSFVDSTHHGRKKDTYRDVEFKNRLFSKISQTAMECGISRLYGGIHTDQDNQVGLLEGKKVGQNINQLHWIK